jgi:hypothetical protein
MLQAVPGNSRVRSRVRYRITGTDFPFPQIATGDLDVAVLGQLPAANLPFGDEFEPGAVQVVGFEAPFRRERL